MSRNRRRHHNRQIQHPSVKFPRLPYEVIGMVSIKTIRSSNGKIIIQQGEVIREEILANKEAEEVFPEIVANAMAGRKR